MTKNQKEIVKAFADGNMQLSVAAKLVYKHRNTVGYHLKKIKKETGLDPMNFYDLEKLLILCKEEKQ
jgi:sugar diacid utilization regulator